MVLGSLLYRLIHNEVASFQGLLRPKTRVPLNVLIKGFFKPFLFPLLVVGSWTVTVAAVGVVCVSSLSGSLLSMSFSVELLIE